jgi:hypothetical protein
MSAQCDEAGYCGPKCNGKACQDANGRHAGSR